VLQSQPGAGSSARSDGKRLSGVRWVCVRRIARHMEGEERVYLVVAHDGDGIDEVRVLDGRVVRGADVRRVAIVIGVPGKVRGRARGVVDARAVETD
jgi:hypothetical protein